MAPFLELTDISKITRNLPQAMQESGYEIRVLMPRFGCINERRNKLHEVIRLSGLNIVVNDNDNPLIIKVASIPGAKMQVYFLDNEEYFHRKAVLTDNKGKFFADNDERAIFFCKGALETVKKLGWAPDIVHCHGWMTSLVPMYLKTAYQDDPTFKGAKSIYSVYENGVSGKLNEEMAQKAITGSMKAEDVSVYEGDSIDALQLGALHYADALIKGGEGISDTVIAEIDKLEKPVASIGVSEDYTEYAEFYQEVLDENLAEVEA